MKLVNKFGVVHFSVKYWEFSPNIVRVDSSILEKLQTTQSQAHARHYTGEYPLATALCHELHVHDLTEAVIDGLWWHDLRATFSTRLALAGYEALTIMMLMGHKDLKTTMRYIRAVQLQRNLRS